MNFRDWNKKYPEKSVNNSPIFRNYLVFPIRKNPVDMKKRGVIFFVLVICFGLFVFGSIDDDNSIILLFLMFVSLALYFLLRERLDFIYNFDVDRGDFNFSKNHVYVINDSACVSVAVVVLYFFVFLLLFNFYDFSCYIAEEFKLLRGLCFGDLYKYNDHVYFVRSLSIFFAIAYSVLFLFSLLLIFYASVKIFSNINATIFSFYSHLSSVFFNAFFVSSLVLLSYSIYNNGVYGLYDSYSIKSKYPLYISYVYLGVYPMIYVFLLVLVSNIVFTIISIVKIEGGKSS